MDVPLDFVVLHEAVSSNKERQLFPQEQGSSKSFSDRFPVKYSMDLLAVDIELSRANTIEYPIPINSLVVHMPEAGFAVSALRHESKPLTLCRLSLHYAAMVLF